VKSKTSSHLKRACAAAVMAAWAGAAPAQTFEVKIGTVTINETAHQVANDFAAELESRSGGRLKARVFPAGQLGSGARQIEGLQLGTQEMMIHPPTFLVGLNPAFQVLDAPGLFDDRGHADRTLQEPAFNARYSKLAIDKGIDCPALFVYDFTAIASTKPVRTLDDLKGMKLRVLATKMESEAMARLGATGVPMDFTEVLQAIQQRTIDGARTAPIVMGGSKFFTVTKFLTMEGSGIIPDCLLVSNGWLRGLPAELRAIVAQVSAETAPKATATSLGFAAKVEQLWKDNGAEVIHLAPAEQRKLRDVLRPVGEQHLSATPAVKEMFDLLKAAVEKTRRPS